AMSRASARLEPTNTRGASAMEDNHLTSRDENGFRIMIESPLIARLLANARAEAKHAALLRVLRKRYQELPEELASSVRACTNGDQLDRWLDALGKAETLEQFCRQTGLEARRRKEDDDTTARDEDGNPIIEPPFIAEMLA